MLLQVLERLGKGAQGAVYLAENNADRKKYVLKQVGLIVNMCGYYQ